MAFFCSSNQEENGVYSAVAYYRLSKDGRKGLESDSIANQRKLILEYISTTVRASRKYWIRLTAAKQTA